MARSCVLERNTKETQISLALNLDDGNVQVATGLGFFDHMLNALAFYAGWGLDLKVTGDVNVDGHHTVEDTGIALGLAFKEALGDKAGLKRFASFFVPMDEALCFTSLDISGRAFLVFAVDMPQEIIGSYESWLTEEFMRAFATNAGITLHQKGFYGNNSHHITEALYKSLGLALKEAIKIEGANIPSTKGIL